MSMMLAHYNLNNQIKFEENKINILTIENKEMFVKLILDLQNQVDSKEGEFVLSKNYEPIQIDKNLDLIIDLFSLDINNRKILNKLYLQIEDNALNTELYVETNNVKSNLAKYIQDITSNVNYILEYEEDVNLSNLFKLFNIRFSKEYNSLLEKITNYITIVNEALNISLFVFVNLKSFLSKEEILKLYKEVNYKKINILLIESNCYEKYSESEKILIIDKDLCEIN